LSYQRKGRGSVYRPFLGQDREWRAGTWCTNGEERGLRT